MPCLVSIGLDYSPYSRINLQPPFDRFHRPSLPCSPLPRGRVKIEAIISFDRALLGNFLNFRSRILVSRQFRENWTSQRLFPSSRIKFSKSRSETATRGCCLISSSLPLSFLSRRPRLDVDFFVVRKHDEREREREK